MAGRPRKSLEMHVWERTFVARKHADRLATEPLVEPPRLQLLQRRYQDEASAAERRALALAFETICQNPERPKLDIERGWEVDDVEPVTRADREAMLRELEEILTAEPVLVDMDAALAETAKFSRAVRARGLRSCGLSYAAIGAELGTSGASARGLVLWFVRTGRTDC
jgi:hypothetical protein